MTELNQGHPGSKTPQLLLFRLYTRGVTAREDYEWRREFGEPLGSKEMEQVERVFELINRQRGRLLRRCAMWRMGDRLHVLLFDLPSARRDHVQRQIVSHVHYVLESAPLSTSSTLSELTRLGLGAALLELIQAHSTQDSPLALIELLDELMSSSEPPSSLEVLSSRLLESLAPPLERLEGRLEEAPETMLKDAQEREEPELAPPTFAPTFAPTLKDLNELRDLEGSPLARVWRHGWRRCMLMSEVSQLNAREGSSLPLWWLMMDHHGGCLILDELSSGLSEELTSQTACPWWALTYRAGLVDTQAPTLEWRERMLTSLSRRFMLRVGSHTP